MGDYNFKTRNMFRAALVALDPYTCLRNAKSKTMEIKFYSIFYSLNSIISSHMAEGIFALPSSSPLTFIPDSNSSALHNILF